MTISILGCGWYGKALAAELIKRGIEVKGSTTTPDKIEALKAAGITPYLIDLALDSQIINPDFFDCDILWLCITPKARAGKGMEYIASIEKLIPLIKTKAVKEVVLISSTGVYSDSNTIVNELNEPQPDTETGKILLAAENLLRNEHTFSTTVIRFGGLIGPGRDPGRFFAGKTNVPNGEAPVNLIHLTDCIGVSFAILEKQAFGHVFNAVSPEHPSRIFFYTNAAKHSGLECPEFISEKSDWKVIDSINVPALLQYNYQISLKK